MKKLRVVIADDETPAREELKHILSEITGLSIIGEAKNGIEAVKMVEEKNPDILFLDIEMPGLNGIEVAKKLIEKKIAPKIIFATAYEEYAVKAFEVNAIDYILKPFDEDRIKKSIERIGSELNGDDGNIQKLEKILKEMSRKGSEKYIEKIPVKQKGNITLIGISDVVYARSDGGLVFIWENGREMLCDYTTLDKMESDLDPGKFYRSSRGFIVNLDKMKEIVPLGNGQYIIRCESGSEKFLEVPLSRRQAKELRTRLKF